MGKKGANILLFRWAIIRRFSGVGCRGAAGSAFAVVGGRHVESVCVGRVAGGRILRCDFFSKISAFGYGCNGDRREECGRNGWRIEWVGIG